MKCNTTRYTIKSDKINTELNGFKMVVLSDLHDTRYGVDNIDLLDRICSINPDIILVAGDLITGLKDRDYTPALRLLEGLVKKWPVYYGLGNHEVRRSENIKEYVKTIKSMSNVHVLDNSVIRLDKGIVIAGITLDSLYYSKGRKRVMTGEYISGKLGNKPEDFTILLSHHPDYFNAYAEWGAELTFSGHLHGGLVRLPFVGGVLSPQIKFFPKYDKGEFVKDNSTMIVSAGLGAHTVPRIFNPTELLVVEIFSIEKKSDF